MPRRLVLLAAAFLLPASGFPADPEPEKVTFTTLSGKTYRDATVTRNEGDSLIVRHAGGVARIPFSDLPDSVRRAHGYDPAAADRAARARAKAESQRAAAAIDQTLAEHEARARARAYAQAATFRAEILQVQEGGLLLRGLLQRTDTGGFRAYDEHLHYLDAPAGLENPYVDGDALEFRAIPGGTHTYESLTGTRTVTRWLWVLPP